MVPFIERFVAFWSYAPQATGHSLSFRRGGCTMRRAKGRGLKRVAQPRWPLSRRWIADYPRTCTIERTGTCEEGWRQIGESSWKTRAAKIRGSRVANGESSEYFHPLSERIFIGAKRKGSGVGWKKRLSKKQEKIKLLRFRGIIGLSSWYFYWNFDRTVDKKSIIQMSFEVGKKYRSCGQEVVLKRNIYNCNLI